jgi:hypothetical protein
VSIVSLVYIDVMVFAYRLLPNPKYKQMGWLQQTINFFEDIEKAKYQGIISTFTQIEYRGLVKKIISNINHDKITPEQEEVIMKDFDQFVMDLAIDVNDADHLTTDSLGNLNLFKVTFRIMEESCAYFHKKSKDNDQWKNIGGADALTSSLAIHSAAATIVLSTRNSNQYQFL